MGVNLTNLYIDETFQKLVQIDGNAISDGTGSAITFLDVTASYAPSSATASYALDSQKLGGKDSSEYPTVSGSNTFVGINNFNAGTAFNNEVSQFSGNFVNYVGGNIETYGGRVAGDTMGKTDGSTVFTGSFQGTIDSASYATSASHAENANTSSNARKVDINAPVDWKYIVGTDGDVGFQKLYGNLPQINNTTNAISASTFIGALQGNATSATVASTATTANKVSIQSPGFDWRYITSVDGLGTQFVYANSPQINDQLNAISASSFTGSLHGTASYALNANVDSGSWDGQFEGDAGITGSLTIPVDLSGSLLQQGVFVSSSFAQASLRDRSLTIEGGNASVILRGQQSTSIILDSDQDSYIQKQGIGNFYFDNYVGNTIIQGSGSVVVNQPLQANAGVTGSLLGTASYADQALSSSYAVTASYAIQADNATTATTAISAIGATNTDVQVKNLEATQIDKGTPLFFTDSGTSGNIVGVYRADAANPARMPAGGIAGEDIAAGAEGQAFLDGYIGGVDTNLFTSGDIVYVAAGGGYINSRPTGSNVQVQALGYVAKAAINGSGVIKGPGVANDLPNLPTGQIVVGDGGGTYQFVTTSSLSVASAVSASHAIYAETAGNAGTWDGQYSGSAGITGSLTVSSVLDVTGVDNLGTNNVSVTDIYGVEVLKVQGLPANKRQNSLIVSGGMQVILPTFQSRFEIAGLAGNTIVAGANIGANDSSGQYSAGIAGGNGGVVQVTDNFNNNDFGIAGQMQQWGYLGDWTGPGIYSNDPGGNYPTIVGFEDASNWTDGRVTFLTPISASAGVTGSLNVSGALSATGNITATNGYIAAFNGNDIFTTVGGNIENRVGTLANNTEKDLVQLGPVTDQFGNTYNLAHNLLANYLSFGKFYRGSYGVEFWDSYGYNYGNEFYVSPLGTRYQMFSPQGKYGADTFEVKTSGTNIGDTRKLINVQEYRVTVDGDTPEAVGYTITNPSGSLAASSSYATFGVGQSYNDPTKTSYSTQANSLNFGNYGPNSGDVEITFGGPHGSFVNMSTSGSSLNLNKGAGFPYIQLDADHRINLYSQNINISSSANINVDALDTYIRSDVEITGSVNISETIKLAPQNPLPTGALGELAVSASNLYFHNGTSWSQIN